MTTAELPNKPHLLPREIMAFLCFSRATVYRYLQKGEIPSKQFGQDYRIPRAEFLIWYESHRKNSY